MQRKTVVGVSVIAEICYESLRILRRSLGESACPPWEDLVVEDQMIFMVGVQDLLAMESMTPEAAHADDVEGLTKLGWSYAKEFDLMRKRSPGVLPWDALPATDRAKVLLHVGIAQALVVPP